ncbi:Uncharacterized protein QTN25_010204 [Entamoeba marina]
MTIQSSHFHRLITHAQLHNLLPLTFSGVANSNFKRLDFYSYGFVKEKLSHKIVSSFTICDPCFFTSFRDCCMHNRGAVYDELLKDYIPNPFCDKSKLVCVMMAECALQLKTQTDPYSRNVLDSLLNFMVNCIFISGCNEYFDSPTKFKLMSPDRRTMKLRGIPNVIWNYHLPNLFS